MFLMRLDNGSHEHDFTKSEWGHALHGPEIFDVTEPPSSLWQKWFGKPVTRQEFRALGHGSVREGDTILVKMKSGKVGRFLLREVEYFGNPRDMFKINRADFVEYAQPSPVDNRKDASHE